MFERVTDLIGRTEEMNTIANLIEQWDDRQVICIHGGGGIGKTRLLQEVYEKYSQPECQQVIFQKIKRKTFKIALVQESASSEWSEQFIAGARDMAKELNVELIETEADSDLDKMKADLEEAISKSPDAIIVREGSNEMLRSSIKDAIKQGIKVLTFDNRLQNIEEMTARVTHNESEGIKLSIEELMKNIRFPAKIAIIRGRGEIQERRTRILSELLLDYPDISLAEDPCIVDGKIEYIEETVCRETKSILQNHPDIEAIWTTWDKFAKGIVRALNEQKRPDISVHSFDLSRSDIHVMLQPNSPWKVTITTDPKEGGRIIVRLATLAASNHKIDPSYSLVPRLITQEALRKNIENKSYLWGETEIGWTPWLRLLQSKELLPKKQLIQLLDILDFDDQSLFKPENMSRKIAEMLDRETFEPFFHAQVESYNKTQIPGFDSEKLREESKVVNRSFAECFNTVSSQKRIVLLFDTTDHLLEKGKDAWEDLKEKIPQLKNAVILIAGRNAKTIGESLQEEIGEIVKIINLNPLSSEESRIYLQRKQDQMHITIEPELLENLIILSDGRPILLDLAVEWRRRGISLGWLVKKSLKEIQDLDGEQKEKYCQEFEGALMDHIRDIRSPIDRLLLLMSHVHPLNVQRISELLKKENARELFEEAQKYVFVKTLPNDYISLHDEMRRMVEEYVWPKVDPEGDRLRGYSELILPYLQNETSNLSQEIENHRTILRKIEKDREENHTTEALEHSLKILELEQRLWFFREQQLHHLRITNFAESVELFEELFDETTTTSHRAELGQEFLKDFQKYPRKLLPEQMYIEDILEILQVKVFFNNGDYKNAKTRSEKILKREDILSKQQVQTLILLANTKIRLGNAEESISDFEKAVDISKTENLPILHIKALYGLGWALRQRGDLDLARTHYLNAQRLCFQQGLDKKELRDDYGWISNNLAFVLSDNNRTRRDAINIAHSALKHWKEIGNNIGLGACYLVLGITYYRIDNFNSALEAFQNALDIFEPLNFNDWLGQIYSWRGALYQDREDRGMEYIERAEEDLQRALKIGSSNIKAMTLNRLGRVYMSRRKWDLAEERMQKSLECAQQIPDYIYWLGSIARLIFIASEKEDYQRLEEFTEKVQDFTRRGKKFDRNSMGMAYIGLAKLALMQDDPKKKKTIVNFLKKGIDLVTKFGSYARTDILSRLDHLEKDFGKIENPEIIRSVGAALLKKYTENVKDESKQIAYSVVTPVMYRWANWKGEEKTDE